MPRASRRQQGHADAAKRLAPDPGGVQMAEVDRIERATENGHAIRPLGALRCAWGSAARGPHGSAPQLCHQASDGGQPLADVAHLEELLLQGRLQRQQLGEPPTDGARVVVVQAKP